MNLLPRLFLYRSLFGLIVLYFALSTNTRGDSTTISNLDFKGSSAAIFNLNTYIPVLRAGSQYSEIKSITVDYCYEPTSVKLFKGTNNFSFGHQSTSMTGERFTYGARTFHFEPALQLEPNTDYSFFFNRGEGSGRGNFGVTNNYGFILKSFLFISVDLNTKNSEIENSFNTNQISLIPGGAFVKLDSTLESVDVFAIDKYEVTLELWNEVKDWGNSHGYDLGSGKSFGPKHPVHTVSWYDTVKWCNARSEKENRIAAYYEDAAMMKVYRSGEIQPNGVKMDTGYRLPTELEWEKAARGGSVGKKFPWGTDSIDHSKARYDPSYIDGPLGTVPVGSLPPNGYGIYDMAGNIEEWCWDWYEPSGVPAKQYRMVRGGGWSTPELYCAVWMSSGRGPSDPFNGNRYGFRSVLSNYQPKIPIIIQQPKEASVRQGDTTSFSIFATNANSFQWVKDGNPLTGATNTTLTLANVRPAMIGDYTAVVSNAAGSVTSSVASVTVLVPPIENTVPPEMALIPAGSFQMGDARVDRAAPNHTVTVSRFAMDKWEVSIELWRSVRAWGNANGYDLVAGGSFGAKHPVHSVNWYDVLKWNNARSEKEGKVPPYYEDSAMGVVYRSGNKVPGGVKWDAGYRLPTEAEWERAARGGVAGKLYPWGTDEISSKLAHYSLSAVSPGTTMPVGSYGANRYGLYDMAGNVWEWCWDRYGGYAQTDQTNPRGPNSGSDRVLRGGSWINYALDQRVAFRGYWSSGERINSYGFRSVYPMTFDPVTLTQQPQSVVGVEGETVQLSVTTTGSPIPTYQWFKDGNAVPGGTNAVLSLANVRPAMIGDYTAVVSNASGSVTSSVASLSIKGVDSGIWNGLVAYYPFNGNALNGSLNNNMAVLNGAVYSIDRFGFRGFAVGFPSDQRAYIDLGKGAAPATIGDLTQSIWIKSDQALESISNDPGRVGLTKHIVIISRFTKGDSGGWPTVEINQKGNLSTELTAPFVGGAFSESSSKNVLDGRWHLLTAVKSGNLYLMYLDGILKSSVTDSQQPSNDANNSPLWIGANYWNDYDPNGTANYRGSIDDVRIYNRALSDTEVKALYDLESTPPVPTVTLAPVATSVVAGQTLTLTAGIAGANLAYRWQKDGVDFQASTRVSGVTSQTLTVQGVVASDAGSYRLTATNLTGSATTPAAVVTVLVPVRLTQQPQPVVGIEGETVQLSVTATGSPIPTYQWLKNGKAVAGANLPTLSLANFAEADAGTYSVVVSNAVNAVTSTQAVVTYQAAIKILANGNPVTGTVRTLNPLSIELSYAKSDWLIFYTLDGSQPTFISTLYQEPFIIAEPASLRVVAYDGLYQNSYLGNPLSIRFLKPQTIDWGDPGAVRFGDTVTLKVASSSGLPVSVSVVSGPATLTGNALKATGTGEVVLQAVQSGTDDFAPVNAQRTITVSPARQTLTWPVLADQKFGNPPVGVAVTAQSGLPVALTVASGKASVKGTNVTLSGAGEVVLRAEQSGNANYEAISEVRSFKVAKAEQTLTVPTIANRAFNPQPFTPSAVVSSGLPVKFTVLSGPALIEQGAVKLTGVGSVLLRAEQPGNDDYEATLPVDKTFVVSKGDQTLTFDAVGGRTFGDPVVTLTAKSSSGLSVSYRVVSGPGSIAGGSLTLTGAGTVLVQAVQAGDANYNPAAANQSIVVAKAAQSITFPALANVGYSTNATVLNATSSSGLAVAYRVIQGAATLSGSALSLSGVGAVSVAADQAGDGNYLPAISVTNAFTVARGDQTIAFTAIGDQVLGNAPITLKGTSSVGLPVTFQLVSGPATVSSGALTLVGEGTVTVRARQVGSPLYNPAQTDQSFVIRKLTTLAVTVAGNQGGTVAVTPLKDLYAPADSVTLTATASSGFAFAGWSGDLTGSANPATLAMSANRAVTASFKDIQAPALTWDLPAAGTTGVEQVRLSGKITDNVGVNTAQWSREGGAGLALAVQANGSFAVDNLALTVGTNRFAVVARDAAGNETKLERQVVWVPQRILTVGNASQVQEGQRLVFPIQLTSSGDVAGLTFELKYDPTYLTDPQLEWTGAVGQSVNNVNQATAGEITATFSMAGSPLPTGSQSLATVSFRGRSVPMAMSVDLSPRWISASSSTGALLSNGNAVEAGSGRITTRRIKGDNNANQRLDIGDAVLISRLQVKLEEVRTWDVGLNDLNASGAIDNGDVVKALRTVVGLDPQPSPGSEGKRLASALGLAKVLVNTNDVIAIDLIDGPKATVGQPYRVAVRLNRVKGSLSGLSFALKYPASLTLTDKQVGALVPGDALPFWNESAGQVSLAAIRSTAWANATGVAAVLTFVPSAGFGAQAEWPLKLEQVEITGSGFDVRPVDPVTAVIQSGGGTVDNRPQLTLEPPKADGTLGLEIRAPQGAIVAVETTSDLSAWTETQRITGQGAGSPVKITLQPDPNVQTKFWRVRVR